MTTTRLCRRIAAGAALLAAIAISAPLPAAADWTDDGYGGIPVDSADNPHAVLREFHYVSSRISNVEEFTWSNGTSSRSFVVSPQIVHNVGNVRSSGFIDIHPSTETDPAALPMARIGQPAVSDADGCSSTTGASDGPLASTALMNDAHGIAPIPRSAAETLLFHFAGRGGTSGDGCGLYVTHLRHSATTGAITAMLTERLFGASPATASAALENDTGFDSASGGAVAFAEEYQRITAQADPADPGRYLIAVSFGESAAIGSNVHFQGVRLYRYDPSGTDGPDADTNPDTLTQVWKSGRSDNAATAETEGHVDGVAAAARFSSPYGLEFSQDGSTLYVADTRNCAIRAIVVAGATAGSVTTVAGIPTGDPGTGCLGPGTSAADFDAVLEASNRAPLDTRLGYVKGMDRQEGTDLLYLLDDRTGAAIVFDPDDRDGKGTLTRIRDLSIGSMDGNPALSTNDRGIAIDPLGETLYFTIANLETAGVRDQLTALNAYYDAIDPALPDLPTHPADTAVGLYGANGADYRRSLGATYQGALCVNWGALPCIGRSGSTLM